MPRHFPTVEVLVLSLFFSFGAGLHFDTGEDVPAEGRIRKEVSASGANIDHHASDEVIHAQATRRAMVVEASAMHTRIDQPVAIMRKKTRESTAITHGDAHAGSHADESRHVVVDAAGFVREDEFQVDAQTSQEEELHDNFEELYKSFLDPQASGLPTRCSDFFLNDCELDIPPNGKNVTEVKEAFLFCCGDREGGGHHAVTCKSLIEEVVTKNEVTEEECKTLVDFYLAHEDLQEDKKRRKKLQEASQASLAGTVSSSSMLDATLRQKGGAHTAARTPPISGDHINKIGSTPVRVQGNDGNRPIIIFYHGMEQTCGQCPHLLNTLQQAGYTVISPCDHNMGFFWAIWGVGHWGKKVYNDVQAWQNHRKIGVLGYSMGGGAAIKVSYDNGGNKPKVPIVAFHPSSLLAGPGFAAGPTLYTTGDGEDFAKSARYVWTTTALSTWLKYSTTGGTKLYLKYRHANHDYPCWQRPAAEAAVKWFDCHVKGLANQCPKQNFCGINGVMECIGLDR